MAGDFKLICIDPVYYRVDDAGKPTIMFPCGKCIVCKERKRRQWALRMENEKSVSKSCFFVTLTYKDDKLYYKFPDCSASLDKESYQRFLKRLRKVLPCKFRFFGVGEYGAESSRPHYHFMIFLPKYMKLNEFRGYVSKCWKNGFNTVKNGVTGRMYYIAKYTVKGSEHPHGTEVPFQTCSINPPIGFKVFRDNYRLLDSSDTYNYMISISGRKSSIPRSFERKYKEYLDNKPRSSVFAPSLKRKFVLQKQASNRLRDYLSAYNDISPTELIRMRENIERRYNLKHKNKINQV